MGIISKVGRKVGSIAVNTTKTMISYNRHVETLGWMKSMGKAVFVPKKKMTLEEMKALAKLPQNPEAFKLAAQKHNASLEKQHNIWKTSVIKSYIGFFAFSINIVFLIVQFSIFHLMSSIGIGSIFLALFFSGSLTAYQMNKQVLDGISDFLHTPTEWLPDPVFHPLEHGGNIKA